MPNCCAGCPATEAIDPICGMTVDIATAENRSEIMQLVDIYHGEIVDVTLDSLIAELARVVSSLPAFAYSCTYGGGISGGGMHAKGPRVTKGIQHGPTRWYQGVQGQMVVRLIEVKPRFVASCQIRTAAIPAPSPTIRRTSDWIIAVIPARTTCESTSVRDGSTPIAITNTHSVGVVRDAIIQWEVSQKNALQPWWLPVVAETWDGDLSDIYGFHVHAEHVHAAIAAAAREAPPSLRSASRSAAEVGVVMTAT